MKEIKVEDGERKVTLQPESGALLVRDGKRLWTIVAIDKTLARLLRKALGLYLGLSAESEADKLRWSMLRIAESVGVNTDLKPAEDVRGWNRLAAEIVGKNYSDALGLDEQCCNCKKLELTKADLLDRFADTELHHVRPYHLKVDRKEIDRASHITITDGNRTYVMKDRTATPRYLGEKGEADG